MGSAVRVAEVEAVLSARDTMQGALRANTLAAKDLEHGVGTLGGGMSAAGAKAEETTGKMGMLHGMIGQAGAMALGMFGAQAFMMLGQSIVGAGLGAIHSAADFQTSTHLLVTGAGESESAIGMVREGLLAMSKEVGVSANLLSAGMFLVESAGFHGAAGLQVMKAAAEGAKVGGADMTVVADALTSALNAYHLPASSAVAVTNEMIAAVAAGKMHMQDFAGALSAVLPIAASVGISFAQVTGAMATMTTKGETAQNSAQNLSNTIDALVHPSAVATKAMAQIGLTSTDVSQNLGKKGLTGTLDELYQAIMSHMGPGGLVLQNAFNQSKIAAADANKMFQSLPPNLQAIATEYQKNLPEGAHTFRTALMALGGEQKLQLSEWRKGQDASQAFNQSLQHGGADAKTFQNVLGDTLGGVTGLKVGLMLTGDSAATFAANVKSVQGAADKTSGAVTGWAGIQGDFNQKLDRAKEAVGVFAISAGTALLPVLGAVADALSGTVVPALSGFFAFLGSHREIMQAMALLLGVVLVGALAALAVALWGVLVPLIIMAAPFIAGAAAAAALAFAIVWLYNHFEPLRAAVALVVGILKVFWDAIMFIMPVLKIIAEVIGGILIAALVALGIAWVIALWPIFAVIAAVVALIFIFTHLSQIGDIIGQVFGVVVGFLGGILGAIGGFLGKLPGIVWGALSKLPGLFGQAIAAVNVILLAFAVWLFTWIATELGKMPGQIGFILGLVVGWFIKLPSLINDELIKLALMVGVWIVGLITTVTTEVPKIIAAVVGFFAALPGKIWAIFLDFLDTEKRGLTNIYNWVMTEVPIIVNTIVNFFAALPGRIWGAVVGVAGTLQQWISGLMNWAANAIPNLVNSIVNFFEQLPGRIAHVGSDIINGIVQGITNAVRSIGGPIGGAIQSFIGGFSSGLNAHSPSKLMADVVGEGMIMAGVAHGILTSNTVSQAIQSKMGNLPTVSATGTLTGQGRGGATNSDSAGIAGTQHVTAQDRLLRAIEKSEQHLAEMRKALTGQGSLSSAQVGARLG